MNNKIVITGIGLITPLGDTISDFWEAVSKGSSPEDFAVSGVNGNTPFNQWKSALKGDKKLGDGVVSGAQRSNARGTIRGNLSTTPRFIKLGLLAAQKAVADAKLFPATLTEAAVTISSSKGSLPLSDFGAGMFNGAPGEAGRYVAREFGCCGPVLNVISACATGLDSIISGARLIKAGRTKTVLAGGVDACLTDFMISGYSRLGVLADGLCQPYDNKRTGFVLSEGAAVFVLEEETQARLRGAKIYGELSSWASFNDGYHITSADPEAETLAGAVRQCLQRSGTKPDAIDYISTHGTGTKENDVLETKGLKKSLGECVYGIPMSSIKPVTGHMLAASGALEFITGLLAMENNFVPPTININDPDPLCDLDYVPNIGRSHTVNNFLTFSSGFGGHVAVAEVNKYRG